MGIDNPLMTITGDDEDGSDALCYYLVVNDYVVSGSCASDYCIENTSGRLYFNKALVGNLHVYIVCVVLSIADQCSISYV